MENLRGKKISLRALEPEDLEFLYALENNETGAILLELISIAIKLTENLIIDQSTLRQLAME